MANGLRQKWLGVALAIAIMCRNDSMANEAAVAVDDARHVKVVYEKGRFAAWPTTNGI